MMNEMELAKLSAKLTILVHLVRLLYRYQYAGIKNASQEALKFSDEPKDFFRENSQGQEKQAALILLETEIDDFFEVLASDPKALQGKGGA